jgi:hypothetical protein
MLVIGENRGEKNLPPCIHQSAWEVLLTLVKCTGWVRKKWWRLSRPMLARIMDGRCDPKRT